jgi:ArsR family transcriptional regulator
MSMQRCGPILVHPDEEFETQAAFFKALGDPHRLAILAALSRARDPVCVCDLTAMLPLNQPTVSHHLRILRDQGLIEGVRRGTWVYYTLATALAERAVVLLQTLVAPAAGAKRRRAS